MILLKSIYQLNTFSKYGLLQICVSNREFINGYNRLSRDEIIDLFYFCLFSKQLIYIPEYIYQNSKFLKNVKRMI